MMKPALVSGVLVLALAGAFGYYGIYQPTQQKQHELHEQLSRERDTQVLRESVLGGAEEIDRLRQYLPEKPETESLLDAVDQLAKAQGIRLTSISPEEPKRVQDAQRLAVTLRFATSYHQLGQFLSALESAPHFLWIEGMDVSRDVSSGSAQVTLTVSSMWVPPFAIPK